MDTEGYLRNLTLSFPDGSTTTVTVDLPTYRAAIEEEGTFCPFANLIFEYKDVENKFVKILFNVIYIRHAV
jgi:hypothetical protein